MEKNPNNRHEVLKYLRSKDGEFTCDVITAAEMLENDERTLFSLFMYAVRRIDIDGFAYNNINGSLFQTSKAWKRGDKLQALQYNAKWSAIEGKLYIEILAKSLAALRLFPKEEREGLYKKAQYRFEDNELRRTYDCKPSNFTIKKAPGAKKAKVVYLELKKKEQYGLCKVHNFEVLLERMNVKFKGLLEVNPAPMMIVRDIPIGDDLNENFIDELKTKLHEYEYNVVDSGGDKETSATVNNVADRLRELFGIDATIGSDVVPGKFNIRIIHNKEYYGDGKDPHDDIFPGIAVQHMTVEDFGNGDDGVQDSALFNVIIKELFIKQCILVGEDTLGKWGGERIHRRLCVHCSQEFREELPLLQAGDEARWQDGGRSDKG